MESKNIVRSLLLGVISEQKLHKRDLFLKNVPGLETWFKGKRLKEMITFKKIIESYQ